ncbi:uncharacterized protein [Antedon mediterranea]|uniref:uncharacterized protein isoform X3 n=1 Tax=Antedon mediterranea TaxID=105859 RepID=UPI003AF42DA5
MGNTESQDESELYQVRDSHIRRDSIPALAADNNLPIEPPELEADLSHLTVEEKKHIQDVLDRARDLEATEEDRIRNLEEDFTSYAESLLSRFTDTESLKDKNFCPICQVTVLSPDALPGTAQEGLPCADCERPVCLQCGFYVTSVATKKDVWLCNMCYHRRHLIASSGSWYHRQRGKPSGSGRRSSLDEATMAINAGRSEGIRFERTASFSEYENIRDSVLESVDIQYVPKVADELRKVASEGLERSGISEIISTGVKFLDQRSSSDETPDDQQHNRQRDSNHSLPENTMTSSFSASDSGLESMRDEDITPTLAEESRTSLDLDDEEMRKMLMQMSGKESTDAKRNQKQDEVIVENTEISVDSVKTISQQQDEIARPNGSTSGRVVASSIHDLPAIKERKSILDSDEFKSIEEQIYSHTEGFKEIFKSFNFGGEKISAGSTSSLDRESSDGHDFDEDDYEEEDLQMEALDIDHTSTVSHDDTATDKTLSPYREEIEMMLANGKRNYSLDCESLSDSEIRVCGGKTKSKVVIGEKPSHAISDPKLSERGRSLLTAEDYLQQGCFLGKNTAKSSSFYGFPSEKEEKPEMRYRSVGDLTKLGMETESEQLAKANKTNRTATPVIVKSQFQYPSNRKQKPNSLPKRKRSRRMIENPLSPIWDVDTSGSPPDADYSSGDFPSPEYADPSLAEESPLEYEDEEDIDIEEESMYDNTIHHYSKDSQMNDIYGSGDLADLLEEDDEDEEFRLHEEYSRKSSLTPEDAFQLETVMEEEEEEYEIQEQLPSPEKISTGSSEKVVENNEVLFESFSSDADSKEDVSIKTPKPRPPPLKLYHDHTKVTPVSTVSSKSDTQVLESPPTPIETSKSFEKPILAKIGDTVTSPDTSKQQNKTNENTLTEKKKPPTPKPRHKPPAPPPIPPKPSLSSIQRTQSQKGVSSVKEIKQTFQQTSQVATKTSKFVQESPQSPRLLATFRQSTEQEGSSIVGREGESLQEKVQQFEQFIRDTSSSPLPESPKRISRSRKNSDSSDNSTLTTELKQENKTGEPRPTAAVRKHVPATKDGNIEGDDAKSTATVATSTSKEDGEVSTKSVTRIASSRKHQRVSVGTETVPEKENDDNEGDKAPIAVMYTTKGTHLLSIRSNQPDSTDVHQLESPSISPTCPTTSSIAVGTSPEGSPPTSDSESLFVPKTKMFREKGVGTDQDVSTAVSSTSSRGSSGSSTPEMIVKRNSKRLPVTDASTTPLMPTSSSRQHTSEGQSEYSSKMFTLPGKPPSHKRHASGIQAQGSDVSDSDSERGGNSETMSKIRRRLPPVPSTRLSITSVGMTADSANEESDSDKTLNLQYIREMLRRKAAELEKQKLEVERAGKKTEEDKKRLDMTAARIFRRQERRQKGTGMIFDVDEMVMMHDSESKSSDDERSKSMSDLDDVLRPFSHGFQLTKSEEDIIKQIEKQISESTGTQYKAYERSEIEREVRQKYGLSDDLRRISTAQRKKHDSRCTHSDGEFEDTIYDSHMSRKKFQSDASVRRTNSSSPPVLRQYRTKDKKRLIDEEKLSKEGELIERKIREDQERQFRKEIERRKRQMEESAKRLEQIKAQRRSDWTGQTSKLSQSMGDIQRTDNRHLGAGMKTMSDAQLDETDGSHTLSLSSPYLPDRGQSVLKRDAHGLILPLDDTPSQSIRRDYQSIQEGREDIPNFKSGSDSSDTRGYRSSRQTDGSSDSDSYQHRNERRRYDSIGRETSSQVHGVMLGKPLLSPSKSAPQRSMGSSPIPVSSTQSYPNLEDHPQNSDSGVHLIGQMSPEEHPDISTSLTRIDDAIRALKLTDQPIPIKRDKPTLRTRASSKSPKRHQRQRPQSANFDLRISRMQKPTESYEAQEMKRSLSTSPPVTDRQFYTQERPSYFKHPAHSSVELNSPFLVAHNQSSRSSSSHTLDSPSSSNNQLKDKTPSPDVVISADVRHKPKESIRVANFNPKNHHDNRHSNKSLSTPPDQPNSGSSSETDKRKRSGSNQISKSTIKADVVIHNEQPRRRSKTHSDDSIGTRSDSSQMSRKPRRKTSRDEDPLNFTSRDPKRRPSYDGGDTIQSAHDESRTESPVFKLQETHARTPYASHYMSDDRPRTSSCHFTTNTTPVHDRKRQDSGVYPRSVTNERVRKRKKTKGSNADSEIAARRLCDLADSNSQLWSRQFESNDRQSSINMKTAVYTRMLIGDNLGPGQVVDPELPRQPDVLWKATRESTGEIKLGLKKDKRSDGDYFYVDIIQCRKMTFKLKDTDHIPDVYVKLFLFMGNKKVSKKKSHTIKQQLEPVFSQEFIFHKPIIGASLQVMLWADGGRFSRNTMVGETMIWLDNVDMSSGKVTAWYRLFTPSSPRTP